MSDANDGARRTGPPRRADGGDAPNFGEYDHEPAVAPDEDEPTAQRDDAARETATDASDRTGAPDRDREGRVRERDAAASTAGRTRGESFDGAASQRTETDAVAPLERVAAALDRGSVRGTVAGVAGVYALLGAGFALLAMLVGGFAPPVVETTWDPYPLVSQTAMLTAVPVISLPVAVLAGGYAAARLSRTDAAVASAVGAAIGAVLATWLTIGGVAVGAGGGTIRIDGVLVASVFLAVVGGGVAAGVALLADRLGIGAPDAAEPDDDEREETPDEHPPGESTRDPTAS
jgi:hypothetical protein